MKKHISKYKKGFTLMESMIAVTILSLFIGTASLVMSRSIQALSKAKDEVIATYLAQEAVEIIKNQKSNNALRNLASPSVNWLEGIAENGSDPCSQNHTCRVDPTGPEGVFLYRCNGGTCPNLKQNSTTFLYDYGVSSVATTFNRSAQIEIISPTEISITVIITWTHGATSHSLRTKTIVTNWF